MHPHSRVWMLRISWAITRFFTAKRLDIVAQLVIGKERSAPDSGAKTGDASKLS